MSTTDPMSAPRPGSARTQSLPAAMLLVLAALLVPALAQAATAWWNGDWHFRKAITLRLPPAEGGAAASVVVPVRLHAGNFAYFADLQPSGADVRFVGADGTPLRHQLELIDATRGLLIAWVQVPVKAGAPEQTVWMYYGNEHAAAADSSAVWDPDQVLVLHFAETSGAARDATANHLDASASSVRLGVPGAIGNGAHFDGQSVVRIAERPALAVSPNGGFAYASWVKLDAGAPQGLLYSQSQGASRVEIGIADAKLYALLVDGARTNRFEATLPLRAGSWQHVAVSIGKDIALYVNGAAAGVTPSGGLPSVSGDVLIGGGPDPQAGGGLAADLDEVQISKAPRSAWWAQVNALTQAPDTTLIAYGTDETKGSSGRLAAYLAMMGNLLAQVSLDGLVVITITALMGLASFQTFVSKALLLKRVEREDAGFLAKFGEGFRPDAELALTGAATAGDSAYAASGLYEMYRAGLDGLRQVAAESGASPGALRLPTEAFEAVRAALDAALVEASNRLNAGLVLMTIAIAGAPFLGLLGTVVGVMITFASIAAAGDVNVNTIAPGVAAAMTATVVGLLVAIPSLFGYNWLATRIARRTSAMEVFADRFLSNLGLLALAQRGRPATRAIEESLHAA